jgi:hypothetical protein
MRHAQSASPLAAGGKSNLKKVCQMISTRKLTHPGEVLLEDVIKPLGLTITAAAKDLGVNGKSALTPEINPVFYPSSITCHLRNPGNCQNVKHRHKSLFTSMLFPNYQ